MKKEVERAIEVTQRRVVDAMNCGSLPLDVDLPVSKNPVAEVCTER